MPQFDLNTALLDAHDRDDKDALVDLYTAAADQAGDTDTTCFFLTHAFIYALEMGHEQTKTLHGRLAAHGRI